MAGRQFSNRQDGAALLLFMVLMVIATLAYLVNNLSTGEIESRRQQKAGEALALAKEALLGYMLTYRDRQQIQDPDSYGEDDRAIWGYLPMPDMGETFNRNGDLANPPCVGEGCTALNQNQIDQHFTYIGRFPWKTLILPPHGDNRGECLWYIVSASHREPNQSNSPMNWDTLGQLDLIARNGIQEGLSGHGRPVAIIISPGLPYQNQDRRTPTGSDGVPLCSGNYIPGNYLELADLRPAPFNISTAIGGNAANQPIPFSIKGKIPGASAHNANDIGLTITSDMLFDALRKRTRFREDINKLMDNVSSCLGIRLYNGILDSPTINPDPPGRIPKLTNICQNNEGQFPCLTTSGSNMTGSDDKLNPDCLSDRTEPQGYLAHYHEQIFFYKPSSGSATVNGEVCDAVIVLANQRSATQTRSNSTEKANPENYLEFYNLDSFRLSQSVFSGDPAFKKTTDQPRERDIVRCVKAQIPFEVSQSSIPSLSAYPMVTVNAGMQSIDLAHVITSALPNSVANSLFGCAWKYQSHPMGSGLRSYFQFRINDSGTCNTAACILDGFTFAIVDADNNASDACGGAAQHIGYSGNNQETSYIVPPKIGFEIDPRINRNPHPAIPNFFFDETGTDTLNNGRNDPPSTASTYRGGHIGIVYWGGESPIAITPPPASCTLPRVNYNGHCVLSQEQDDNIHGHVEAANSPPYSIARIGFPPPPVNPDQPRSPEGFFVSPPKAACHANELCGIYKLDPNRSQIPVNQNFHVRFELSRRPSSYSATHTRVATTAHINLNQPGDSIDRVLLLADDLILVKNQNEPRENGIYQWKGANIPMSRWRNAISPENLSGMVVEVEQGAVNTRSVWRQSVKHPAVGADPLHWFILYVKIVAPVSLNLSNPGATIDGIRMKIGDRVLVKEFDAFGTDIGIYIWNGEGIPMNKINNVQPETLVQIRQGSEALSWWRFDGNHWYRNTTARIATDSTIDLSAPPSSIGGINLQVGDHILVRSQSQPAENGIYVWNGSATRMSRTADAATASLLSNLFVQILEGLHAGRAFLQTTFAHTDTLGIDPIQWQIIDPFKSPDYLIEAWILPDSSTTTNQVSAMKNTTRPMEQLYPGLLPHLRDTPRIPYPFRNVRPGFTTGQRQTLTDQSFTVSNFSTTWLE